MAVINTSGGNRPDVRPSLLMDFANSKTLDPLITFTRYSNGMYYDGKTKVLADQNICPKSNNITSSEWNVFRNTITTGQSDPFGGTGAVKITGDGNNGVGTGIYVGLNYSGEAWEGNEFTLSVYAKSDQTHYMYIGHNNGTTQAAAFDVSGSGNTIATPTNHTASIVDIGDGWKRVSITFDISVVSESNFVVIGLAKAAGLSNDYYNTSESVYLYGPQVVNRGSMLPYTDSNGDYGKTVYQPKMMEAFDHEPRFDHDPVTGESKGLLVEKSKTNSITWSHEFNNWTQMGNARRRSNLGIAPDGTQTADELYITTGGAAQNRYSFDGQVVLSAGTYTFSVYMKSSGLQYGALTIYDGTAYQAEVTFDLLNGTTVVNDDSTDAKGMEDVGNGWYRCWVTATITQDLPDNNRASGVWPRYTNTSGAGSEAGQAAYVGAGILVWGAQLDTAKYPSSYMPTSGATNTRSPDIAIINGENFESFYTYSDSTMYAEWSKWYNVQYSNETGSVFKIGDGGGGYVDMIQSFEGSESLYQGGRIYFNQQSQVAAGGKSIPEGDYTLLKKEALAWKDGDFAWATNGESVSTGSPTVIPKRELNTLHIGRGWGTSAYLDGHIRKIAYYPSRLTNNQITALVEK